MAKGLEDTAFYRYFLLLSLNEVGGHASQFGLRLEVGISSPSTLASLLTPLRTSIARICIAWSTGPTRYRPLLRTTQSAARTCVQGSLPCRTCHLCGRPRWKSGGRSAPSTKYSQMPFLEFISLSKGSPLTFCCTDRGPRRWSRAATQRRVHALPDPGRRLAIWRYHCLARVCQTHPGTALRCLTHTLSLSLT